MRFPTIAAIAVISLTATGTEGQDMPAHDARRANRLAHETSPYLLQHAYNPVDWYPWGPEAFEAARTQDKPIFLSIGYSTCYWCHVMERESFENEAIAAIMNEKFISIKVDREERPDVDDIYMAATQIFNRGSGGWPMSVFLEPQTLKPFVAGTYFPPADNPQLRRPGFPTVLNQIAGAWATNREGVMGQANYLAELVVGELTEASWTTAVGEAQVDAALSALMGAYDRDNGGFGGGTNKFPMPAYLDLFMGPGWKSQKVRDAVLHTLDRMATGGMYDQVGGGFHRYSTDRQWLVPHFEKMLYDNGQLASVYATAYERTGDPFYAEIVHETLGYVLREMTSDRGGFYSAQDAEVNAREGGNYVWTADEIRKALLDADLADGLEIALEAYGFNKGPNFQDPHHPEDGRKNVVFLVDKPARQAAMMGYPAEWFDDKLREINTALLAVRDTREQPGLDDKVLAGWNGLMIGGMADGGRVLEEKEYVEAAIRAANFVLDTMRADDGGLLRVYRDGRARIDAFLDDYALMIRGLIALYHATDDPVWIEAAEELTAGARDRFWDDRFGAYFETLPGQSDLFVRTKSTYDGAVPSGNGVMLLNLLDLHEITGKAAYLGDATAALEGLSTAIDNNPLNATLSSLALSRFVAGHPDELARIVPRTIPDAQQIVTATPSVAEVTLKPGEVTELTVTVDIGSGYHINAHEPGLANLIPLELGIAGAQGIELEAGYPPGEPYQGGLKIHTGTVVVPVRLRLTGPVTGTPSLLVQYQVCTDTVCLAPFRVTLPLAIKAEAPVAGTVKPVNPGG